MTISNGVKANAENFNDAFVSKTADDEKSGKFDLTDADSTSVLDVQKNINSQASFVGQATNGAAGALPTWLSDAIGSINDAIKTRVEAIQTVVENNQDAVDDVADIRTTLGTAQGSTDLGAFTGGLVTDNSDLRVNLQEIIDAIIGIGSPLTFQGTWDANANTPDIGAIATAGDFWIVATAGTTDLSGITDWQINDWAVFDGTTWYKIDNSDVVTSVNGQSGTVVLDTDDINEGATNLYYTDTRADARIAAASIDDLADVDTTTIAPNVDEALVWDGSNWVPGEATGGGGSGLKNFIPLADSTFEVDVIGDINWGSFNDGAVSVPVDGDGGTASEISFDLTTTLGEVLEGEKSFKVTKSAADAQGQGVRLNLQDIELAFQDGIAYGSFFYDTSSANYAETWGVWLYDRDGTALINILEANNFIPKGKGKFEFSFLVPDNAPNASSIRLILMETDTNTNAYDLIFDVFATGPDTLMASTPTVKTQYAEIINGTGVGINSDITGPLDVNTDTGLFTYSSGVYTFNVDCVVSAQAGFTTVDALPVILRNNTDVLAGDRVASSFSSASWTGPVVAGDELKFRNGTGSAASGNINVSMHATSYNEITGAVRNSQLSFDSATIAANFTNSTSVTDIIIPFDTIINGNNIDTSTGIFTAPNSAVYTVFAQTLISGATDQEEYRLKVEDADTSAELTQEVVNMARAGTLTINTNKDIRLEKGQRIRIMYRQSTGSSRTYVNGENATFVSISEKPFSQTAIVQQNKVAKLYDQQAAGVDGGSSVVGTQDRVLNTLDDPFGLIASLSSNQFTFSSVGKYYIVARCPQFQSQRHGARITLSDNTLLISGESSLAGSTDNTVTFAQVEGYINVTDTSQAYKIRHYIGTSKVTNGLGEAVSDGSVPETYTTVKIMKVGE